MRTALFLLLVCPTVAFCQFKNVGAAIKITNGTALVSTNFIKNEAGGTLTNNGSLIAPTNLTNAAASTLDGSGTFKIGGDWTNAGTFAAGSSTVVFNGSGQSTATSGGSAFFNISLEKTNQNLVLASPMQLNGTLNFLNDNNFIVIGNQNWTFGPTASTTGFSQNRFIVTASTGRVFKENMAVGSSFQFPVGFNSTTFNPISLTQNAGATTDALAVRCLEHALQNGSSGAAFTDGLADVSWEITENTPGGNNLSITSQWSASDELPNFNRNDCGIARFSSGSDWELPPARMGAATGAGPFSRTANGLTAVGVVAVSGESLMDRCLVSLKIFLQGAGFDVATQRMNDVLRAANLLPTAMPSTYASGKFAPVGWQPPTGFSVAPSVFTVTGNNAIVDWVFVFLKNPTAPFATIQTRPALVQRDGDVVDLDGVSPLKIPASAGSYGVGIGHRNHLSIRTPNANPLTLNELSPVSYDFTTAQSQAYGTNPMKQIATAPDVFGLWAGNANANLNVRYTGPSNDNGYLLNTCLNGIPSAVLSNQYSNCDLNMNGVVRYSGPNNDSGFLLNSVLGGVSGAVLNEQF